MAQKVYYGDIRLVTWKDIQDYVGSIMGSLNLEPLKYLEADSSGLSKILTSTKQFDLRNVTATGDAFLTVKNGADVNLKSPGKLRVLSRDELYLRASNTVQTDVGLIASDYTPQYILASTYLRKETGSSGGLVSNFKVATFTSNANGGNAVSGPHMFLGSSTADGRNNQARMVTSQERAIVHMENNWAEMTTLNANSQQAGRVISTGTGASMLSNNGTNNFSRLDLAYNYLTYQNNSGYALLAGDESGWPGTIAANTKVDGNFIGTLGNLPAWMDNIHGDENGISKIVFTSTFSLSTKQSGWDKPVISMTNDQYLTVGGYVDANGWVRENKSGTRTVQTLITGEYAAIAAATQSTSTDPAAVDSILLADSRYYGAVGVTSDNTDYQYQGVIQQRTGAMIGMSYCAAEQVLSSSALLNAGTGTGHIQNSVFSPGTRTSSTYADLVEAGFMRLASSPTDPLLTVNSQSWGTQAYVLQAVKDDSAATGTVGGKVYGNMPGGGGGDLPSWINNIYGDEEGISAINTRSNFMMMDFDAAEDVTGAGYLLFGYGHAALGASRVGYSDSSVFAFSAVTGGPPGVRNLTLSSVNPSDIDYPYVVNTGMYAMAAGYAAPEIGIDPQSFIFGNSSATQVWPLWLDTVVGDRAGIYSMLLHPEGFMMYQEDNGSSKARGLFMGTTNGALRKDGIVLFSEYGNALSLEDYNGYISGVLTLTNHNVSVTAVPPSPGSYSSAPQLYMYHSSSEMYSLMSGYNPQGYTKPSDLFAEDGVVWGNTPGSGGSTDLPVWINNIKGNSAGISSINVNMPFLMTNFDQAEGEGGAPYLYMATAVAALGTTVMRNSSGELRSTYAYALTARYDFSTYAPAHAEGVAGIQHLHLTDIDRNNVTQVCTEQGGSDMYQWGLLTAPECRGSTIYGCTSANMEDAELPAWIDCIQGDATGIMTITAHPDGFTLRSEDKNTGSTYGLHLGEPNTSGGLLLNEPGVTLFANANVGLGAAALRLSGIEHNLSGVLALYSNGLSLEDYGTGGITPVLTLASRTGGSKMLALCAGDNTGGEFTGDGLLGDDTVLWGNTPGGTSGGGGTSGSGSNFITEDAYGITGITLSSSGFRMGTNATPDVLSLSSDETLSLKAANGIYALSDFHL